MIRRLFRPCRAAFHHRAYSTAIRPFIPSPEQLAVVKQCATDNVVVSARPGSGKTATAEAIVAAYPTTPTAIITYSKRLQLHTAQRLAQYPCADVYTFHGIAGKLFSTVAHTDGILRDLRRNRTLPVWVGPLYERLVLDEIQDMTPELYWLTCSLISTLTRAAGRVPQLVVLGDARQAIYEFRGADARCLDLAPSIFSTLSPYPWQALPLSVSFRLSRENANFVNDAFLGGEKYIEGSHDGPLPLYVHADLADVRSLSQTLVPLIHEHGPENTAIIAPFVRDNVMLSRFTNVLSQRFQIPVAVSTSDDISLDPTILHGKVTVSTYHQFKGSERDLVIVYGVDASYFGFMGRDLPDDRCPNATFVAITRARKQLVLIQSDQSPPMPFIAWPDLLKRAELVDLSPNQLQPQYKPGRPLQIGLLLPVHVAVTEIIRHVRGEIIEALVAEHLQIIELESPLPRSWHINAPDRVPTNKAKKHFEAVSDLNGLAVTAAYEWDIAKSMTTFGYRRSAPILPDAGMTAQWLAREATTYEAKMSGYKSRMLQMQKHTFDWLDPFIDQARDRLKEQFPSPKGLQFEVPFRRDIAVAEVKDNMDSVQETRLVGRADIVQGDALWEIKFVSELTLEHALQAIIYGFLWAVKKKRKNLPTVFLFNVRDGAKWEVRSTLPNAQRIIEELLRAKYTTRGETPTEEFLEACENVRREVEEVEAEWEEESGKRVVKKRKPLKMSVG